MLETTIWVPERQPVVAVIDVLTVFLILHSCHGVLNDF